MADYGLRCYNQTGDLVFNFDTNAVRVLGSYLGKTDGSQTVPGLLQGSPWWYYRFAQVEFGRPVDISVVGDTIYYSFPTAGLISKQMANDVLIVFGTR